MLFNLNAIKDYRESQKRMAEILNEATMTNTPMSEREKELLGTAKAVRNTLRLLYGERPTNLGNLMKDLNRVIAAYDPKPEKEYTMPEWVDFYCKYSIRTGGPNITVMKEESEIGERQIFKDDYNAIREALSKPKAPTE